MTPAPTKPSALDKAIDLLRAVSKTHVATHGGVKVANCAKTARAELAALRSRLALADRLAEIADDLNIAYGNYCSGGCRIAEEKELRSALAAYLASTGGAKP